jgi:hypothetical protein
MYYMRILKKYINRFKKMTFTFGIISDGKQEERLHKMIDSIEAQGINEDRYQIIVIGGKQLDRRNTTVCEFDERQRVGWITKKKNLISQYSRFQNIVYMHDYVALCDDWYQGWCEFTTEHGENWDMAMNRVLNMDGNRFRDYMDYDISTLRIRYKDYTEKDTSKVYTSGTFFLGKKDFMIKFPFDESKVHMESEDLAQNLLVRHKWNYVFNPYSSAKFLKMKDHYPPMIDEFNFKQDGGIETL